MMTTMMMTISRSAHELECACRKLYIGRGPNETESGAALLFFILGVKYIPPLYESVQVQIWIVVIQPMRDGEIDAACAQNDARDADARDARERRRFAKQPIVFWVGSPAK